MFHFAEGFCDGVIDPESLEAVLENIAVRDDVAVLMNAIFGRRRLLECRGIAGLTVDGRSAVAVDSVRAWMDGRLVAGENLCLVDLPRGASSIYLAYRNNFQSLSDRPAALQRQSCQAVLLADRESAETKSMEIARLSWLAGRESPEIYGGWWPDLSCVSADNRSLHTFEQLREALLRADAPDWLVCLLARGRDTSWRALLWPILQWMQQRGHRDMLPDGHLGDDSQVAACLLERLEQCHRFPVELKQLDRRLSLKGSVFPTSRKSDSHGETITFDRADLANCPARTWLAMMVDSDQRRLPTLKVDPGDKTMNVPCGKPVVVSCWSDETTPITITINQGQYAAAALYIDAG